jgi:very-short-patch-repair endonuclease
MDADHRALSQARLQHGLITTGQALAAGLSRHQIATRLGRGQLVTVHRGVYAVEGSPRSDDQRLLAAVFASRGSASHRAGMRLWHLEPDEVLEEVTVLGDRVVRVQGAVVHRSKDLHPDHVSIRDGIPVTNPLRLLADLGLVLPAWRVERVYDLAVAKRLVTPTGVTGIRWQLSKQGRNGVGVLQAVLDAAELNQSEPLSVLEAAFVRMANAHGLPKPELQHPVVVDGRHRRLDAAWPDLMLAVEVDGFASRIDRTRFQDDRSRQNGLIELGWTVLRFTWTDVVARPAGTSARIRRVLRSLEPVKAA